MFRHWVLTAVTACLAGSSIFAAEKMISLPAPDQANGKPLMRCLAERHTERVFSPGPLSLQDLSDILYAGFGINRPDGRRTVATARNFQDPILFAVLKDGVYRYDAAKNALVCVVDRDIRKGQGTLPALFERDNAPLILVIAADLSKYPAGENQLYYPLIHAGGISHSLYLIAASKDLATVVRGRFDRENLQKVLALPENQRILLVQLIGKPAGK